MPNVSGLFEGKVAIVTGGSSGIGRAASLAFAAEGARVVVVGRDLDRIAETVRAVEAAGLTTHGAPMGLALDVCRPEEMDRMVRLTMEAFGRIDVLVANAGTLRGAGGWPRRLVEMSVEEWDEVVRGNLTGVYLSNRAVLPVMIRQRCGDIINVSSTSGLKGLAYDSAYSASKFGVIGLTEAVAEEVRSYGVRVQVLLPGAVDTPMWRQQDAIPHLDAALPVERVADAIVHIAALPRDAVYLKPPLTPFQFTGRTLATGRVARTVINHEGAR